MISIWRSRLFWIVAGVLVFIGAISGAYLVGGIAGKLRLQPFTQPIDATEALIRSSLKTLRGDSQNSRYIESALLELRVTELTPLPSTQGNKVGFSRIGPGYLVAHRDGLLAYVTFAWPQTYDTQPLQFQVPVDKARFLAEPVTERHSRIPVQFGVKDILAVVEDANVTLYASHHFWLEEKGCAVMRISTTRFPVEQLLTGSPKTWRTLFDSTPCMKLDGSFNRLGEDDTFLQAGGRIADFDSQRILVTVGDHFLEGIHNRDAVQDPQSSYGKTLLIDKSSGATELFTTGHRNAQGLTRDQYGQWWLTEHGPRGGDELNRLERGANYGWPKVSFGTLYAGYQLPEGLGWGGHDAYTLPVMAWPVAIAPSNLIRLHDSQFKRWRDDLIVATLGARSLVRLHAEGGAINAVETIELGDRLRDLEQTEDGALLVMSDDGTFFRLEPAGEYGDAQTANPRALWMTCAACHKISREPQHHIGPDLFGVVGRDIASAPGFTYSPALQELEGVWSEQALDAFLKDPNAFAPGTSMVFPGIEDASARRALIDFLRRGP